MFTKDAKYIIFDSELSYVPVVFPSHVQHNSMAMMLGQWAPDTAGFVRIDEQGNVIAYGESVSLKLKSDPVRDNKLLAQLFNK